MIVLELISQGLPETEQPTKIKFKEGLNVVTVKHAQSAELIRGMMLSMFFGPTKIIRDAATQQNVRCGMIIRADNMTLQLMRDFSNNQVKLTEYKEDQNKFIELSSQQEFVDQLFNSRLKLPTIDTYLDIFCPGGEHFVKTTSHQVPSSIDLSQLDEDSEEPVDKTERLRNLKKQLVSIEQVEQFENQMTDLQQEVFNKEDVIRQVKSKQEQYEALEQEVSAAMNSSHDIEIPADVESKINNYLNMEKEKLAKLEELDRKADRVISELAAIPLRSIHHNPLFIGGITGFVLGTVGAIFMPSLRLVATSLIVVAIGTVAYTFFKQISHQEKHRKKQREMDQLDRERKSLEKKYDVEMSDVSHLMARLQVSDPNEILALAGEQQDHRSKLKQTKKELDVLKKQVDYDSAVDELKILNQRTEELQKKMAQLNTGGFDPQSVRREIEEIENQLSGNESHVSFSDSSANISTGGDCINETIMRASQLLKLTPQKLLESIGAGIETNLMTISNRQLSDPVIKDGKILALSTGKAGKTIAINDLDDQQSAFLRFGTQFTLLQVLGKNGFPLPVFSLDFPDNLQDVLSVVEKAWKHLAQSTQVIQFTHR